MRRRSLVTVVAAGVLALGACSSDQDPGVDSVDDPSNTGGATSNTLGQCPPGGPDVTTPPAGCLDPDGSVVTRGPG